jgi:D-methionine transport system ATP-binding protein
MIELQDVSKTYHLKGGNVNAVRNVSLSVADGEIFGVIGYSGAGKSSLVRCINLLEVPDSGSITVNGTRITWQDEAGFHRLSNHDMKGVRKGIGMIFQHFNLLDRSTVFDNVAYPLKYSGLSKEQIRTRVRELLELVGLSEKAGTYPSQLSGGQKQRVAIARALANNPPVLLSDEATSALDPEATESILSLLKELNEKLHLTIILITHEMAVIKSICHKVAVMEDGRIVETGDVYSVFADPQQEITRKFIGEGALMARTEILARQTAADGQLVRLQFQKTVVGDALISDVSRRFAVDMSIVLANVEIIQGSPLGEIIVLMKGAEKEREAALAYLEERKVRVFRLSGTGKGGEA